MNSSAERISGDEAVSRLLCSEFSRLFKNRLFWLGELFMAGLATFAVINVYRDNIKFQDYYEYAEELLFDDGFFIFFVIAVFVSIFIGTEYSDGTMRNKLVTGHSRISIYFSNLIVCTVFSFIMKISYMALILALGIPMLGISGGDITAYIIRTLVSFAALIAITSIILLVSMLIQSKSAGSVTALILTLVCICAATYFHSILQQPEYYDAYVYLDENDVMHNMPSEPNPNYISGTKRTIYQFIDDAFPYSQLFFIDITDIEKINIYPLYSIAIAALTTGCGVLVFRKKNLR